VEGIQNRKIEMLPTRHQTCIKELDAGISCFFSNLREELFYVLDFNIPKTSNDNMFVKFL